MAKETVNKSAQIVESPFSSNFVRLSWIEWLITLVIVLAVVFILPFVWASEEQFNYTDDFRLPYKLGEDYELYERLCKEVSRGYDNIVVGDSVVWGQFVESSQTLSHHLSVLSGKKFANMGIDGLHPIAAYGLIKYYGRDIKNKNVYLHFNFLWISSSASDLQTDKEVRINHPGLIPQFFPKISCYFAPFSVRLGTVLNRFCDFCGWVRHIQLVYLQNDEPDISFVRWFVSHPYQNPFAGMNTRLGSLFEGVERKKQAVEAKEGLKRDLPFVEIDKSLQWKYFMKTIEILQERQNKVFVIAGPFNEHILNKQSFDALSKIKSDIEKNLLEKKIKFYIAEVLPEDYFADPSHPIAKGYEYLAKEIVKRIE